MIRRFRYDDRGNVGIMFAVVAITSLASVGAALDHSKANSRKADLQAAADIAVLAASSSDMRRDRELKKYAREYFSDQFVERDGDTLDNVKVTVNDGEIRLEAQLRVQTSFLSVIGKSSLPVSVNSASAFGNDSPLDVAFVLDRTGSMAGPNLNALKSASSDLINDMITSGADVRVSVIPFADYVNVGVNNASSLWANLPGTSVNGSDVECRMVNMASSGCTAPSSTPPASPPPSTPTPPLSGSCSVSFTISSTGDPVITYDPPSCSSGGSITINGSMVSWPNVSTTPAGAYCTTPTDPQEDSGRRIEECTPVLSSENWFGCMGSRNAPYNLQADHNGQNFPIIPDRTCGQPLLPLTNSLSDAVMRINDLTASGMTYIPAGLQWGWSALTPGAPLEATGSTDRTKLLILMTDGQNTVSQAGSAHIGTDYNAANTLTAEMCSAIKADGIKIATVAYSLTGSPTNSLLQDCASSGKLYFTANNRRQLKNAFEAAIKAAEDVRLIR